MGDFTSTAEPLSPSPTIRFGIIGCGNGACALAVHAAQRFHQPVIWAHPEHRGRFNQIEKAGSLDAYGVVDGTFCPKLVEDLAEFLALVTHIVIITVSTGHDDVLNHLRGHDLGQHTVTAVPGNLFARAARKKINARAILQTSTLPFGCRTLDGKVFVKSAKKVVPIAALERGLSKVDREELDGVFGGVLEWRSSVLEIDFMCVNAPVHVPTAVLNTGRTETNPDYYFYRDGMSPSVSKVIEELDKERLAIARAYGFEIPSLLDDTNRFYGTDFSDYATFAKETKPHNATKGGPSSVQHRFFVEDVSDLLVPWEGFGLKANVHIPLHSAFITLASSIVGLDHRRVGKNLRALGLDQLSVQGIRELYAADAQSEVISLEMKEYNVGRLNRLGRRHSPDQSRLVQSYVTIRTLISQLLHSF